MRLTQREDQIRWNEIDTEWNTFEKKKHKAKKRERMYVSVKEEERK